MGGSDVHRRYGDTLGAYQLETTLSPLVQRDAALADGACRRDRYRRHLSVRFRRDATVHLFPVLAGLEPEQVSYAAHHWSHRRYRKR